MAMTTGNENGDMDEMLDSRRITLHRFVKYSTYLAIAVIVILALLGLSFA